MSLKALIMAGDFLPPCSGSSERVWILTGRLVELGFNIFLSMHIWRDFDVDIEGIKMMPFPRWRFYVHKLLRWFIELLKSSRYDILQVELFSPLRSLLARVALHPFTRKTILVIHDLSWLYQMSKSKGWQKLLNHVLILLNLRLYDLVIFVSEDLKRMYSQFYGKILEDKTAVVPSGIPLRALTCVYDRVKSREKLNLPKETFIVVFFGPMHAPFNREAAEYLYAVSAYVSQRFREKVHRNLMFVIAGRGTEKLASTPYVRPLSFVEDIFELLAVADACIIPHKPSYTGPHVKTLYAFAAGCPVIATLDGVKGLDAKEYEHYMPFIRSSIDTLVEALVKIAKDEELRQKIVKNSKELVRKLTWENITREYARLILKVLKG